MKKSLSLALLLLIVHFSFSQTTYESSHVKNGETIQFTIPKELHFVEESDIFGDAMFSQGEGVDFSTLDFETTKDGFLLIMHQPIVSAMKQSEFLENLQSELEIQKETLTAVGGPEQIVINGKEIVQAGLKGEVDGKMAEAFFVSTLNFGDYAIFISYYANEGANNPISFKEFAKIIASWKVVKTDREDGLADLHSTDEETMYEEEEETNYLNDLFETTISYYDILPEYLENWDEPMEENTHLLSEFIYKNNNGSLKVFSGGDAAKYPSAEEKARAVQQVLESGGLRLKFDSEFANEDHLFRLYTISGGGSATSVYTTVAKGEMVFFVVDNGANPVPDFKPAVRDFMLTMWVDEYSDMEDFMRVEEE